MEWLAAYEGDLARVETYSLRTRKYISTTPTTTYSYYPDPSGTKLIRAEYTTANHTKDRYDKDWIDTYVVFASARVYLYNPGIARLLQFFRSLKNDNIQNIRFYAKDLPDHHRKLAIEYSILHNKTAALTALIPPEHSARYKNFYENTLKTGKREWKDEDLIYARKEFPLRPEAKHPPLPPLHWKRAELVKKDTAGCVFMGLVVGLLLCAFLMYVLFAD